jgi:hypothetical protein
MAVAEQDDMKKWLCLALLLPACSDAARLGSPEDGETGGVPGKSTGGAKATGGLYDTGSGGYQESPGGAYGTGGYPGPGGAYSTGGYYDTGSGGYPGSPGGYYGTGGYTNTGGAVTPSTGGSCGYSQHVALEQYCAPNGCRTLQTAECRSGVIETVESAGCGYVRYAYSGDVGDKWTDIYDFNTGALVYYYNNGVLSAGCNDPFEAGYEPPCSAWQVVTCGSVGWPTAVDAGAPRDGGSGTRTGDAAP